MEVSHYPSRVALSLKHNTDTYQNIVQSKDFVINFCDATLRETRV
jgi:flavin reductase (DIM6/NTAB) family NADH-FMN oxidoreductase RutF